MKTIQIPGSRRSQHECVQEGDDLELYFPKAGTFTVVSGGQAFTPPIKSIHVGDRDCLGPFTAPRNPSTVKWEFSSDQGGAKSDGDIEVKKNCPGNGVPPCK